MIVRSGLAWATAATVAIGLIACAGCSGTKGTSDAGDDPEAAHLGKVGEWAGDYAKAHGGKAPSTLEKLKAWAEKNKGASDDDFVSTVDHKPYVLGVTKDGKAMIHEEEGKSAGNQHYVHYVAQGDKIAKAGPLQALEMELSGPPKMGGSGGPPPGTNPYGGGGQQK